jgi:hypothetical protein
VPVKSPVICTILYSGDLPPWRTTTCHVVRVMTTSWDRPRRDLAGWDDWTFVSVCGTHCARLILCQVSLPEFLSLLSCHLTKGETFFNLIFYSLNQILVRKYGNVLRHIDHESKKGNKFSHVKEEDLENCIILNYTHFCSILYTHLCKYTHFTLSVLIKPRFMCSVIIFTSSARSVNNFDIIRCNLRKWHI